MKKEYISPEFEFLEIEFVEDALLYSKPEDNAGSVGTVENPGENDDF